MLAPKITYTPEALLHFRHNNCMEIESEEILNLKNELNNYKFFNLNWRHNEEKTKHGAEEYIPPHIRLPKPPALTQHLATSNYFNLPPGAILIEIQPGMPIPKGALPLDIKMHGNPNKTQTEKLIMESKKSKETSTSSKPIQQLKDQALKLTPIKPVQIETKQVEINSVKSMPHEANLVEINTTDKKLLEANKNTNKAIALEAKSIKKNPIKQTHNPANSTNPQLTPTIHLPNPTQTSTNTPIRPTCAIDQKRKDEAGNTPLEQSMEGENPPMTRIMKRSLKKLKYMESQIERMKKIYASTSEEKEKNELIKAELKQKIESIKKNIEEKYQKETKEIKKVMQYPVGQQYQNAYYHSGTGYHTNTDHIGNSFNFNPYGEELIEPVRGIKKIYKYEPRFNESNPYSKGFFPEYFPNESMNQNNNQNNSSRVHFDITSPSFQPSYYNPSKSHITEFKKNITNQCSSDSSSIDIRI